MKSGKPVRGIRFVLNSLKKGGVKEVYVAFNCVCKDEVLKLCKVLKVLCHELEQNNVELGVICKRAHSVSALCFLKK